MPVVRLSGVIGAASPLRPGLTLAGTAGSLERAFTMRGADAVAIAINSPGGSPVQSTLIFKRIRALAAEHELPVYVFAEDVAASGGYMLACAGDEIYADESSVVGSIGVISAGFGFSNAIDKLGIERRVYTAGKNKMILDPFQPEKAADVERLKTLQRDVHDAFKALVSDRRGDKLSGDEDEIYSGAFWAGVKAREMGLIDGLGDMRSVMREKLGEDVQLKVVQQQRSWLKRRLGADTLLDLFAQRQGDVGSSLAGDALAAIEERAIWQRYGL
ncbi:MAG: S49 family peptidase [Pseudomonadota bacterium]